MLGPDQPVILQLHGDHAGARRPARRGDGARGLRLPAAAGTCRSPTDDDEAFGDVDVALLVGVDAPQGGHGALRPAQRQRRASSSRRARRSPRGAQRDVKVLVVGNPANTNCLIAQQQRQGPRPAPLHRDDAARPQPGHRPAGRQGRASTAPTSRKMTIWGNHSATQYPDVFHAEVAGKPGFEADRPGPGLARGRVHPHRAAARRRDHQGPRPVVGGVGRQRRRRPRALWVLGTPDGDWVSMGVVSDGSYGAPEGIITGFPCTAKDGEYEIVQGLDIDDFSRARIDKSNAELVDERDAVRLAELGPRSERQVGRRRAGYFEELAGGVVGEDLAAGLARWRSRRPCSGCTRRRARRRRTRGRPRRRGRARAPGGRPTSSSRRGRARRRAPR